MKPPEPEGPAGYHALRETSSPRCVRSCLRHDLEADKRGTLSRSQSRGHSDQGVSARHGGIWMCSLECVWGPALHLLCPNVKVRRGHLSALSSTPLPPPPPPARGSRGAGLEG